MNQSTAAYILADMLKTGTTTRSKKQIADELDKIKTNISFNSGGNSLNINISTDKQNLPAALTLLEDLLKHPKFDATEFDKTILDAKATIESGKSDPQTLAGQKLGKMTSNYPPGHPLYTSDADEDLADLAKLKLDDVKKFYADFYGANNSLSTFVGELDKPTITGFLQNTFGKWNSKEKFTDVEKKYFETKAVTETINTPDKTNAMMLGGLNMNISRKNPDYPAILMANDLLGGGAFLSSRIAQRLRENEGMSYGAGSFINVEYKYNVGTWGLYAFFNPTYKGRLDSALRNEVDKAIKGGFTADELAKAKKSWEEQNRTTLGSNDNLAGIIQFYMQTERDLDEYTKFQDKISVLTLDAVNEALRKHFNPSKLVVIYGGDFEKGKTTNPTDKKGF
jgi:zinc protease